MKRFSELDPEDAGKVRFVLMDIDDTLTRDGRLLESAYSALWRLKENGIRAVPITGRPAGWCDLIARQWPVEGVVGENGAFVFRVDGTKSSVMYHPETRDPAETKKMFDEIKNDVLSQVDGARIAKDQFCRIFDLAIDFAEEEPVLPLEDAVKIKLIFEKHGAIAKISSIHVNGWFGHYNKLSMAELFLEEVFGYDPERDKYEVLFFGDSPNDEPMFGNFPLSCAVANFSRFADLVKTLPSFVTDSEYGDGFAEGIGILLEKRNHAITQKKSNSFM